MTALIFALGLLPQSADSCHYDPPIKITASLEEVEIAKKRHLLATLLIEALKDEANHKIDRKREERIQHLLRELLRKEPK